jgi:uncharacterized phage infection (PIP) family protein YhgE
MSDSVAEAIYSAAKIFEAVQNERTTAVREIADGLSRIADGIERFADALEELNNVARNKGVRES